MAKDVFTFQGKYIIKADLCCLTGLHIGGTAEGFEIGGIDNPVIKDPLTGLPYIPGSSLKGKMRSLVEWAEDKVKVERRNGRPSAGVCKCGKEDCVVCVVFGTSAAENSQAGPTRLTVRDAFPKGGLDGEVVGEWEKWLGEKVYTEFKTENAIDRITSEANPRTMERVPADSVFEVEMIYDVYRDDDVEKLKYVFEGMALLEDSSLGGSGSRGHGKVRFENISATFRPKGYYQNGDGERPIEVDGKSALQIVEEFDPSRFRGG
ncbi:MAG: type III-A CRISPR-associated RAMP protein Csm3 [bacterium]